MGASTNDAKGAQVAQSLDFDLQNAESAERSYLDSGSKASFAQYGNARQQVANDLISLKEWAGRSPDSQSAPDLISAATRVLNQFDRAARLRKLGRGDEAKIALQNAVDKGAAVEYHKLSAAALADAIQIGSINSGNQLNIVKTAGAWLSAAALIVTVLLSATLLSLKRTQRRIGQTDTDSSAGLSLVHTLPIEIQRADEQYQRIIETFRGGIWVVNTEGETTLVNPHMADILGYSVKEMLGRHHVDFMDTEGVRIADENTRRRKMGLSDSEDFRFLRKDGTVVWALVATSPLKDGHGIVVGAIATVTEITERKRAEKDQSLYRAAIEASAAGIVVVDALEAGMPIVSVNRAFETLTGYQRADVIGHPATMLRGATRSGDQVCAIQMARRSGSDISIELCSDRKDTGKYWQEISVSAVRDDQGEVTHFVALQNDLSRRQAAIETIEVRPATVEHTIYRENEMYETPEALTIADEMHYARPVRDELTGLHNGRTFQEDLDHESLRALRYNTPLSVLLLNIDNLQDFVDINGASAAQRAIVQIGEIIQDTARQTDRVARIAGERFGVIMINTDQSNSTVLAERLRRNVERGNWPSNCSLTATVGVATFGVGMADSLEFLRCAEDALLHAEAQGSNHVAHRAQFDKTPPPAIH